MKSGRAPRHVSRELAQENREVPCRHAAGMPPMDGGKEGVRCPPTMFTCGNDDGAKKTVRGILDRYGWETADRGASEAARDRAAPTTVSMR